MPVAIRKLIESPTEVAEGVPFVLGLRVQPYNYRMRQARLRKGWTQKQLAEVAGIGLGVIQELEQLRRDYNPQWDVLDLLASLLEVPVEIMFPAWLRVKALRRVAEVEVPLRIAERDGVTGDEDVLAGVMQGQLRELLYTALEQLPWREHTVLRERFGLDGDKPKTLGEVANRYGVTPERIRAIEEKALRRLRVPAVTELLAEYGTFWRPWLSNSEISSVCSGSGELPVPYGGSNGWGVCPGCDTLMAISGQWLPEHFVIPRLVSKEARGS